MKKPKPVGSMEGPDGLKVFAKFLVDNYALGPEAARFSVVSFQSVATTRVGWSTNQVDINAAIDQMKANGGTSISAGLEAAGQLFTASRPGATKIVLLVSDGEQRDEFGGPEGAIASADLVKASGVTVFAWGMGKQVSLDTMEKIATDASKAISVKKIGELLGYLADLEAAVCNVSPSPPPTQPPPSPSPPPSSPSPPPLPPPPPMPSPPPPPWWCVDIGLEGDPAFCANTDPGPDGGVGTIELKVLRCKSHPWESLCQVTCGKCSISPVPLLPSSEP